MLTSGDGVLKIANEAGFAVPAFNISDYAMFAGISDLCEELQAPWMVAIHPDEFDHVGADFLKAVIARAHRSSVPMAIHLDHGGTYAVPAARAPTMTERDVLAFLRAQTL